MSKRLLLPLLLVLGVCSACSTPKPSFADTDLSIKPAPDSTVKRPLPGPLHIPDSFKEAVRNGTRTMTGRPGPGYWNQFAAYKLEAALSPEDTTLYGKAEITYKNNSPYNLPAVFLELAQNLHTSQALRAEKSEITGGMQINSVLVRNKPVTLTQFPQPGIKAYGIEGTLMYIVLDELLSPGDSLHLEIDYQFKIPQAGAGERMGYADDNLFFLGYWYPQLAVLDDIHGWFTDPFTGNAEFYHGFANYEVSISAPEEWVIMGTGEFLNPDETLSSEIAGRYKKAAASETDSVYTIIAESDFGSVTKTADDGTLVWKFKADTVTDAAYSITRESVWQSARSHTGSQDAYTQINTFWRPSAPGWSKGAEFAQHAIRFFSHYTGIPYRWPHITAVEGGGIISGGMEYPMITLIGAYNNLPDAAFYDVMAHELAHMWLPMLVSSNERRHAWMDEGAVSFHEAYARWDYFHTEKNQGQEFASYLQIAGSEEEGEIMRHSDFHYTDYAYNIATYSKPASLLFALQGVLGTTLFNKAWQEYIARWAYKHPSPYDFFHTVEDVTGKNLDWFWQSWYYETWVLDQAVESVITTEDTVAVVISDLGNVPMPVDLTITLADDTVIEKRISQEVWLQGRRSIEITFPITSEVLEIAIDKNGNFPDINRNNNIWSK